MKYHCKAVIEYEFDVYAKSADAAEQVAVELLADDVIDGIIRTDLFLPAEALPFPTLERVEVKPYE